MGLAIPATPIASAHVNTGWDWHLVDGQPKRVLDFCIGTAVDVRVDERRRSIDVRSFRHGVNRAWGERVGAAVKILNDANAGWELKLSGNGRVLIPPCQVVIFLADIPENVFGGGNATPQDTNGDGKADITRIVIDSNLEDTVSNLPEGEDTDDGQRDGFSTKAGEQTRDPVGVLVHELSHALRLDHHPDSRHSDESDSDISDPRKVGDHTTALSEEDIREMRASSGSEEVLHESDVSGSNQDISFDGVDIQIAANALGGPGLLHLNILEGVAVPDPLAVPADYSYAMASGTVYIRTAPLLQGEITISIPYTDEEIEGGDDRYVGDAHSFVPPRLDESTLQAFRHVPRPIGSEGDSPHWEMVEGSTVDSDSKKVTFTITETGIYAIAAKPSADQTRSETDVSEPEGSDETDLQGGADNAGLVVLVAVAGFFGLATVIVWVSRRGRSKPE